MKAFVNAVLTKKVFFFQLRYLLSSYEHFALSYFSLLLCDAKIQYLRCPAKQLAIHDNTTGFLSKSYQSEALNQKFKMWESFCRTIFFHRIVILQLQIIFNVIHVNNNRRQNDWYVPVISKNRVPSWVTHQIDLCPSVVVATTLKPNSVAVFTTFFHTEWIFSADSSDIGVIATTSE